MSGANEYPFAGDLSDPVISGLLHSTLERLARRTAQNNTYISNIYEAGPETQTSSACGSSFCAYAGYDATSSALQYGYSWNVNFGFASGHFHYYSTGLPTGSKFLSQYRYRRNVLTPESQLTRAADGSVTCQNNSTEIHDAAWAYFAGGIPTGTFLIGEIIFNLPENFKGFRPEGIELDLRGQATGLAGTDTIATVLAVYRPHCTVDSDILTYTGEAYLQNNAPGEVVPVSGTADTYNLSTHRLTAKALGDIWRPGDTVKLQVYCTSSQAGDAASLALYVGALKVNYKQ